MDATIPELLENLKLPEYRTRYRTRRELRGRDKDEVLAALNTWISNLDEKSAQFEQHLLEALWVTWGLNHVDGSLVRKLFKSTDHKIRAAVVKVIRYAGHQIEGGSTLLKEAAADAHGRVRLEAMVAASWMDPTIGIPIVEEAGKHPLDKWNEHVHKTALAHLNGEMVEDAPKEKPRTHLIEQKDRDLYFKGLEIYERDGFCGTCHQENGKGLEASGFPPLAGTKWVVGNEERLIKIALNGLHGPIEVLGKAYPGQVPMTPYGKILKDDEIAAVLTYVRNAFENRASVIYPEKVTEVRESIQEKKGFFSPAELLEAHPHEDEAL